MIDSLPSVAACFEDCIFALNQRTYEKIQKMYFYIFGIFIKQVCRVSYHLLLFHSS